MGDGFQVFDILLFAAIAGFLVFRLRSVLGRRTGNERRRDPFATPPAGAPDKVVPLPPRGRTIEGVATPVAAAGSDGLAAVRAADPSFDQKRFLDGARGAFEIIVNAFAAGDTVALRPLLSDEVYDSFAQSIRQRQAAGETLETSLMSIKSAEIAEGSAQGNTVLVTVKFVSDQINVTKGAGGKVVDGDPERIVEKSDFWTFSRNVRSRDPNWILVATQSP
jgi:predicted lipid-binding transport protein (Tim44 family)